MPQKLIAAQLAEWHRAVPRLQHQTFGGGHGIRHDSAEAGLSGRQAMLALGVVPSLSLLAASSHERPGNPTKDILRQCEYDEEKRTDLGRPPVAGTFGELGDLDQEQPGVGARQQVSIGGPTSTTQWALQQFRDSCRQERARCGQLAKIRRAS